MVYTSYKTIPGLAPLAFQMFFTSVVSTATLAPPFWLECSTASSAASCLVVSGMSSPLLMTTQWLPGAFCTWNHRSLPRAVVARRFLEELGEGGAEK